MGIVSGIKYRLERRIVEQSFVQQYVQQRIKQAYPASVPMGDFRQNDIFVVGYPKSGNTWMQNLMANLIYGVNGEHTVGRLVQELIPDVHYKKYFQRFSDISCFKSHHFPRREYRKVIYIVRDGRDVLVSYFYYINALSNVAVELGDLVENPIPRFGTWSDHVEKWLNNPYEAKMIVVRYEDLLTNSVAELEKITEFAGINRSATQLSEIIENNGFSSLRKKEEKHGFGHDTWKSDKLFFRRGIAGEYKDELPWEIIDAYQKLHGSTLSKMGYACESNKDQSSSC